MEKYLIMKKYHEIIRELRIDKDKTQLEIAELLQTDQSYYSKYERGIRALPIEHLITLCKYYNVSSDYILGLPKNMPYPER